MEVANGNGQGVLHSAIIAVSCLFLAQISVHIPMSCVSHNLLFFNVCNLIYYKYFHEFASPLLNRIAKIVCSASYCSCLLHTRIFSV